MRGCESYRPIGAAEAGTSETFDPHHFYVGYLFDRAETRQHGIATLLAQARRFGYPSRYWWASEVVEWPKDWADVLVVCVHHRSAIPDVTQTFYEAVVQALHRLTLPWSNLEPASVEVYRQFGKPVRETEGIRWRDGAPLFPLDSEPESAGATPFRVDDTLSGSMRVTAPDADTARQTALDRLHGLVRQVEAEGLTAE